MKRYCLNGYKIICNDRGKKLNCAITTMPLCHYDVYSIWSDHVMIIGCSKNKDLCSSSLLNHLFTCQWMFCVHQSEYQINVLVWAMIN